SATASIEEPVLKKIDYPNGMDVVHEHYVYNHPLQKRFNQVFKRSLDLVVSSFLILAVLSWLLPVMALLIRIDSRGPVFFLQKRNKINGGLFTCIKFRTMVVNADADTKPASMDDRRITRLGNFLRKHHLDEWPQLLNVWLGDMSLIGPRPHMLSDNRRYESLLSFYACRHYVKPGITGLAQVKGYVGTVSTIENLQARIAEDLYYINNWSPALDARIIWYTVGRLIRNKSETIN
ncbi:MAG: sugar transferase, partial [Flavisolibacter sp.]